MAPILETALCHLKSDHAFIAESAYCSCYVCCGVTHPSISRTQSKVWTCNERPLRQTAVICARLGQCHNSRIRYKLAVVFSDSIGPWQITVGHSNCQVFASISLTVWEHEFVEYICGEFALIGHRSLCHKSVVHTVKRLDDAGIDEAWACAPKLF